MEGRSEYSKEEDARQNFKRMEDEHLLRRIPESVINLGPKIGLKRVTVDYIKTFLKQNLPQSSVELDEFRKFVFAFDKFKARKKIKRRRKTLLSARKQRQLAVYKLDSNNVKFDTFVPIHEMWKEYMQEVLQLKDELPKDLNMLYQKLLKADYHGCMLAVASSACPNYVGVSGIVAQETRNVFRLVTPDNKVKTIPKKGSVFCFQLQGKLFKIYGNNFRFLPHDRFKIKYKTKSIVHFSE